MLLTRLPAGWLAGNGPPSGIAEAVWAFPVVGAAVGALGGAVYWACSRLGLPPPVGAVWTLGALLLATGALHEDGLADTADGFGGGPTRERKLEIMRDSRIGGFGALALMLSLAARGTAIAALATPGHVAPALVAAGALGRGAILLVLAALPPARADGLASSLRETAGTRLAAGVALAVLLAWIAWRPVLATTLAAGAVAAACIWAARRQIGGYTGDVLGATSVLVECAVLGLAAAERSPVSM